MVGIQKGRDSVNFIQKYFYFLTKPLKLKPLYKKSNLSNAIDYTQKIVVEDKLLDIRMTVIHLFYYNDFKHYCLSNHLNPLDELYTINVQFLRKFFHLIKIHWP